jgi:hypothetical protein
VVLSCRLLSVCVLRCIGVPVEPPVVAVTRYTV